MESPYNVPTPLVDSILKGRCIAFVGAGFTGPAVPPWATLLESVGQRLEYPVKWRDEHPAALELEAMGQVLRDAARDPSHWEATIKSVLEEHQLETEEMTTAARSLVRTRCQVLQTIPFRAILTTNFDHWLPGSTAGPDTYWQILREDGGRWWDFTLTSSTERPHVPVIKLHGDANGNPNEAPIVLSRSDYRRRLYSEQSYKTFLRAAFAEYTVLFLGVSFTDAYLNELRSEIHHLLHPNQRSSPWGYAVFTKTPKSVTDFFRKYEAIEALVTPESDGHDGFDRWLHAIASKTSVEGRLRSLISDQRIVWVDANPENNQRGTKLFESCGATVDALESDVELDESKHAGAALLVTQFGYESPGESRAYRVLDRIRTWADRPPVIVFADPDAPVAKNRTECLRRGAWEYATAWSELYRRIEVLFDRVPD